MATKQARGTKRTCQSDECGARFYDLNRDPIACPICGSVYEIASGPVGAIFKDEEKAPRKPKKDTAKAEADIEATEDGEDVADEEETVEADADDAFLEDEEEEEGSMSNIVGGRGEKDEEV
ncbi:MAG: TIGR02300 family protein [Hyphomicrobiaceae bacterium]